MKELKMEDNFTSRVPYLFGRDYIANYAEPSTKSKDKRLKLFYGANENSNMTPSFIKLKDAIPNYFIAAESGCSKGFI